MEIDWKGVGTVGGTLAVFAIGMTAWVIHMRRHPVTRMTQGMSSFNEWLRRFDELKWSVIYAGVTILAAWILLNWVTHAVATGHLMPLYPKRSPWTRLMFSRQSRPWNTVGIAAAFTALAAMFFRAYHWPVRAIGAALQRAAEKSGLSYHPNATVLVYDWRDKYLDKLGAMDLVRSDVDEGQDLQLISNRCWALQREGDDMKLLVVAQGHSLVGGRDRPNVVWVCLYIRTSGGGHVLSPDARQKLLERKFEIRDLPSHVRVSDMRLYDVRGMRLIRAATDPDRIADLWRIADSR